MSDNSKELMRLLLVHKEEVSEIIKCREVDTFLVKNLLEELQNQGVNIKKLLKKQKNGNIIK